MEVIYISGPMTGYPNFNREAFTKAKIRLIGQGKEVVSPVLLEQDDEGRTWKPLQKKYSYYLKISLSKMLSCNAIVMLPGWEQSKGAKVERYLAEALGYKIYDNVEDVK